MQTAYSETEGYVPVTTKAQQSDEYRDYISREGEDNDDHYQVKIEATKLLLEHAADTFITPVFNGSASLRDAAGQLIENVTKSIRRKETVDDAYIDDLFTDVSALYRLDQISQSGTGQEELGEIPAASKLLLTSIATAWLLMGAYAVLGKVKRGRTNKQ